MWAILGGLIAAAGKAAEKAANKAAAEVAKSPPVLDFEQVQKWLTASAWALIALNLFAVSLFLISFFAPQIKRFRAHLKNVRELKKAKLAEAAAEELATEPEPKTKPAEATAPSAEPATPTSETVVTEAPTDAPSTSAVTETAPLPEPSPPEPLPPPTPSEAFEQNTEVIPPEEIPQPEIAAAASDVEISDADFAKPAEPEVSPPPPAEAPPPANSPGLSADTVSVQNDSSMNNPPAPKPFQTDITEILSAPIDATEEIPIFDTSEMDDAFGGSKRSRKPSRRNPGEKAK